MRKRSLLSRCPTYISLFNIGVLRNGVHEFTISVILNFLRLFKNGNKNCTWSPILSLSRILEFLGYMEC